MVMLEVQELLQVLKHLVISKRHKFTYDTVEQTATITDPTIISKL
jgi:hypothetical protein